MAASGWIVTRTITVHKHKWSKVKIT